MVSRKVKTDKRRIPIKAVMLYQKLKAIKQLGLEYVPEPLGHKLEYNQGRYQLCRMLKLREPWQSFPVECDDPKGEFRDDDDSYRARCHRLGWEARCALEQASR